MKEIYVKFRFLPELREAFTKINGRPGRVIFRIPIEGTIFLEDKKISFLEGSWSQGRIWVNHTWGILNQYYPSLAALFEHLRQLGRVRTNLPDGVTVEEIEKTGKEMDKFARFEKF